MPKSSWPWMSCTMPTTTRTTAMTQRMVAFMAAHLPNARRNVQAFGWNLGGRMRR
jgi:hypothetical protein